MKGRKPKARKAGDALPARVEPGEVEGIVVEPPATLPPEAVPIWREAVKELGELLRPAHLPLVEQLAVAALRHQQAQAIIAEEGLIVRTKAGPRQHPAVRIERDSAMLYGRICDQLGLSPTARQRLGLMYALGQSLLVQVAERVDAHIEAQRQARRQK